jgi:DNA-binding transcriptional LysR family regulator
VHLNQLRYFLGVVDHGGVGAAAAALGVAQPTVSQAIHELERELGVDLFHRLGRGLVLAAAGRALVGPARRVLRDVAAAEGALVEAAGEVGGRLDLTTLPALAAHPVAGMVSAFRRAHPNVFVRIGDLDMADEAPAAIRQGDCEVAVCYLPIADDSGLTLRRLGETHQCVAYPPGTEIAADDPLPLSALPDVPLVVLPRGNVYANEIERAIAESGSLRRPAAVVGSVQARLPFVLAGVGGSFLPRELAEGAASQGVIVRTTSPSIGWPFGLVYDESTLSIAGRAFVDLVCRDEPSELEEGGGRRGEPTGAVQDSDWPLDRGDG